jgi:hypothetical protein
MTDEARYVAQAAAALGDKLVRLDELSLCFDPSPDYRAEVKRRLTKPTEPKKDEAA